jgi:plasmid stabilization system protein ParE
VKVRILSCAEREFAEAVDFYNTERPGLGYEFAEEVQDTLDRIAAFPRAWPLFSINARRCFVRRFPYGVLYQVHTDFVLVVALLHMKRSPQTWQRRGNI